MSRFDGHVPLLATSSRITPPCVHFLEGCGGCAHQNAAYEDQLRAKEAYLKSLYGKIVPVVPARSPLGYRSRMDYVLAFGKIGLRSRSGHRTVVDTPHCLLLPECVRPIYLAARALIRASGLPDHDYLAASGYLKYLVVRTSIATGETMLILTTAAPDKREETTRSLLSALAAIPGVTSAWWAVNESVTDISVGQPKEHREAKTIAESIAGVRINIGPKTFSQGNAAGAGRMFERAIAYAQGRVLDLCCGAGILGILAAKRDGVTDVVGVDIVEESIAAARENAKANGTDITFIAQDLTEFLRTAAREGARFDTVLCDPARPGLGSIACDLLLRLAPKRIIYISCNPVTHRRDLSILAKKYDITLLEGYDLFPQTPHVEILSVLEAVR